MEDTTLAPVPLAMVGRALLSKFDQETIQALVAAISEEVHKEVFEAAVVEARATLEDAFAAREERLRDQLARDRRQIEQDADHRVDQEVAEQLAAEQQDWADRLDTVRTQRRDWRARAEAAEAVVVSLLTQLCHGVDQRPVYLYSQGVTELDRAAINAILARAGVVLKSKATVSERKVVVRVDGDRLVEHSRFWLTKTTPAGVIDPDDDEEEAAEALARPEGTTQG